MASFIPCYEFDIFISYRQNDSKHGGLLETHNVDASLKEKLKNLVIITIISRTCFGPKSFVWDYERIIKWLYERVML
jgi:hypothetical protein